ncbi:MAG: bifunctional glutamate N-acetyltransferase/amino-acid acetyltransferase ArgJ [Acidimicrobiales bacterium]
MSVTHPEGFVAASGSAGIKGDGSADVSVVATDDGRPVRAAGVFTSNLAPAASVRISRAHLGASGGRAAAVIATSGNANAATGAAGMDAANELCGLVARALGTGATNVLICQTGLIGVPFPMETVRPHIAGIVAGRGATPSDALRAARAIMTTDTAEKQVLVPGDGFSVGGMAKGAAMLSPNMATMLAILTTDANVEGAELSEALAGSIVSSFNSLSVDASTSTNDTVLVLASGRGGRPRKGALQEALSDACGSLALQMATDAEGSTKVFTVTVIGASSDGEARKAARKVGTSLLVKCSMNGADAYWGRVLSELGSAGVAFDPERVCISYGGIEVCRDGVGASFDEVALGKHMGSGHVALCCDLGLGDGEGQMLSVDLGHGYIDENRTTS